MNRLSLLSDLLDTIGARTWFGPGEPERQVPLSTLTELCGKLVASKGEATGVRIAAEIIAAVRSLDERQIEDFFRMLANRFAPDQEALSEAARAYAEKPDRAHLARLQALAEPPRQELFRRLNLSPGGTGELVKMRERLLPLVKAEPGTFGPVDSDLRHLFGSWFNRGFLLLRPIDWQTPANILEKIIAYEAVHAIDDWDALRQRLAPVDRRCFAFFHPSIADDPLIFVEVALTREIPASIGEVLDSGRDVLRPSDAQTAVFYSISNCHKGLAGVSFGSFLIKQVAEDLKNELPGLKTFVTLSPAPTFARWLNDLTEETRAGLEANELKALEIVSHAGWHEDDQTREAARPGMLSLAARYFLRGKRADGQPIDPVARFHLGNGALLNRMMHAADLSPSGLRQSHGLMVNYLYDLPKVEQRHEAYAADGALAASRAVTALMPARGGSASIREVA